ncbi:hypothetical protein IEO21_05848 [Rhodonia placenta]|uniref:Uncharacterized protein n=1 Tax=Rhodonia placenta TaxID=104341 RepID=A0A8H7P1C8_9APHY|nr:hypothetical protein IEO21_05848 [Postia placenta]
MGNLGQAVHVGLCIAGLCTVLLMQPQGLVSQHSCVSSARAMPCTAAPSNLIVQR